MSRAAKNSAALTALVMVIWTEGETAPRITECLDAQAAAEYARLICDNNAAKRASEDAARATLTAAGHSEWAALVETTPAIKVQIKRLHGDRALTILRAMNAVEIAHETDGTTSTEIARVEAALVSAYLAA